MSDNDSKVDEGEVIPAENMQIDLQSLVPLAQQLIINSHAEAQKRSELEKERLRLQERWQSHTTSAFKHKFWLVSFITFGVVSISAGLMFYAGNIDAGLLIMSHVGAIVAGAMAGSGWEKSKDK